MNTKVRKLEKRARIAFIIAIVLTLALALSSCTPVYDYWKKAQTFMYIQQGMYYVDSLAVDSAALTQEGPRHENN